MQKQNGADMSVLPDPSTLTVWQKCLRQAIIDVQDNATPYKLDGAGATQDIYYDSRRILWANEPPTSMCVGATMEAFIRAWKSWTVDVPASQNISGDEMWNNVRPFWFAYSDPSDYNPDGTWKYIKGSSGALLWLASRLSWLKVCEFDNSSPMDVEWFQFGDTWSMQNSEDGLSGHSTLFIKNYPDWNEVPGKNVAIVWSSNIGYDNSWLTKNQDPGTGFDWWNYQHTYSTGWKRKIYSAGIRNTGWPDVA